MYKNYLRYLLSHYPSSRGQMRVPLVALAVLALMGLRLCSFQNRAKRICDGTTLPIFASTPQDSHKLRAHLHQYRKHHQHAS